MSSSGKMHSSTKTFHKESKTTTSYQKSSSVTTYYSKKVTTYSHASVKSSSKASLHLNIQSAHRSQELSAIGLRSSAGYLGKSKLTWSGQGSLQPKSSERRATITSLVLPRPSELGNSQVTFSNSGENRPTIVTAFPPENSQLNSEDLPFKTDGATTLVSKNSDKVKGGSPTHGKKADKDEAFKKEQIRRYREGHLTNLVGPRKGVKT